jgi:hypothetical protein
MSSAELTKADAINWLIKTELPEDRAIETMMEIIGKLYGLSLDQQARVIATIGAIICIEAENSGAALEEFCAMTRQQVEAYR